MNYSIQRGDTLSQLAQRFNTTVGELAQANGIQNPDLIYAGADLEVPGSADGFDAGQAPGARFAQQYGDDAGGAAPVGATGASPGAPGEGVSQAELQRIMPNLSDAKAQQYLPHLNAAMAEANINTPERQAAFLSQLAHESGELRYMEEIASGAAYEGRSDLGNTQPGDGTRFKGRGPIQLTGRANYQAASRALGVDLVGNPEQAASPEVAFRTAAWYWNSRDLNQHADSGDFNAITYRINGGYNGAADRNAYYARAQAVL